MHHVVAHLLQSSATQALLGYHHPLAVVLERLTVRVEQTLVALTMLAASLGALGAGVSYALAAVVASAVAALGLGGSVAILASDRRACVRDLIIEGRGDLRLAVVEREPRRLLGRTHRAELARSLDTLCEQAQRQAAPPQCSRPLYRPSVLIAVAPELHAIARLVERGGAGPAGVAMTERLLNAHDSPLYGPDATLLREQLRRIAFALNSGDTRSGPPL
jgi:hypothetical protein